VSYFARHGIENFSIECQKKKNHFGGSVIDKVQGVPSSLSPNIDAMDLPVALLSSSNTAS
jgi:hypothetical protein